MRPGRRGHGEGSITRLPDGRWQARLDLGWVNGKRRRKAFFGRTRKDAVAKLNAAFAKRDRALPIAAERESLGQYLEHWLLNTVKPSLRPSTHISYASYVNRHLIPGLGKR